MYSDSEEGRQLVARVSYDVVSDVAPEELEIFNEVMVEYYEPEKLVSRTSSDDDPLGFGIEGAVALATPAAIAMVSAFLNQVFAESVKILKDESTEVVKEKIKSFFEPNAEENSDQPEKEPPNPKDKSITFDREQLAEIRKTAVKEARKAGVSKDEAERLANALFVRLALA